MLSFRSVVVTGVAAVALWGLFELLDTLREPGLLRTEKAAVIKGCETIDSDETRAVCPQLFCQKAVMETRQVSYTTRFAVTVDQHDGADTRLIGGGISGRSPDAADSQFVCLLDKNKVVGVKITSRAALSELAGQAEGWEL